MLQWYGVLGALLLVALTVQAVGLKRQANRLKAELKAMRLARRYDGKGRIL